MRRGSPIRTSSDHSPFIGSPRLIADFHVLHRLLMPRHPPCALTHSHPPKRVGFSVCEKNTRYFDSKKITLHTSTRLVLDARVHYTILKPLPITSPAGSDAVVWVGSVPGETTCGSRTQQRVCSIRPPTHRHPRHITWARWLDERKT